MTLIEGIKSITLNEIFTIHQNSNLYNDAYQNPTVEQIGAIVCDLVTSVSQSYLISHIIPNCGKNLIEFKSEMEGKRERKVYHITWKGKKTLRSLIDRQQKMRKYLLSMIISTSGITDSKLPSDLEELLSLDLILDTSLIDKTDAEKLEILVRRKAVISRIVEKLQNVVGEIDQRIDNLKVK